MRRLGFKPASTLRDALEMAEDVVGRDPSITHLHSPPSADRRREVKLVNPLRRAAFPFVGPTWPTSIPRPPAERTLGVDYETDWARKPVARFGRALLLDGVTRPIIRVLADPQVRGTDRLVGVDGPVIFAGNHASHVDTPLLLTSLPERFRHKTVVAAGADYFFDRRWKATLSALALAAIPIERTKVSRKSAAVAADAINGGWNLIIFPEGGRSPDGWGQGFRPGAAWLALRTGAPVIPVHLEGTRRVLRKGRSKIRPSSTTVTFGSIMHAVEGEDARGFAERIEKAVAELADEQATDWWSARRRAAAGTTPSLTGPDASAWRRTWQLGEDRRRPKARRWP